MFGYIKINPDELKGKDANIYGHFYCGLCRALKRRYGEAARATLTYDMTFLALLLTGLYGGSGKRRMQSCMWKGGQKRISYENPYLSYAADINLLLSYHKLMDDWIDERKLPARMAAQALTGAYRKAAERYPKKEAEIRKYLQKLHQAERSDAANPDLASGLTGELMKTLFVVRDDIWKEDLGKLGFYLGKWIYLRDAYEDVEEDRKNGTYNPLIRMTQAADFDRIVWRMLTMQAAEAARAFERLPIVAYADILRNILYSGIWLREEKSGRRRLLEYNEKQKGK